ncbi:hypothetical protein I4U23_010391 [Adineta vaga]|nr:hypothetical protein I4U23_010391 [Adineta vaga]
MINNNSLKLCEVDEDSCRRQARVLCFHCSKNLCRIHLEQHSQLIEENTRTELNSLADKLNELSSKFNDLVISSEFLQQPFSQLEKWCLEAHAKIDEIVEKKRMEINYLIDEYGKSFSIHNKEKLEKINDIKKTIAELIRDNDASTEQITELQKSLENSEKYLNTLNTHTISATACSPIWLVDIHLQSFDCTPNPVGKLRGFNVNYIRLDGSFERHYLKTNNDGTMNDLLKAFVHQYSLLKALIRLQSNLEEKNDHQPNSDFILPTEVYNHQIQSQYSAGTLLSNVKTRDSIVFYEVPKSISSEDNPHILMPCCFQRQLNGSLFGWPIYLNVPRKGCRGQDVKDSIQNSLGNFFLLSPSTDLQLYDAYLHITRNYTTAKTKLDTILNDEIDFTKANATLYVNISDEVADQYEQNVS